MPTGLPTDIGICLDESGSMEDLVQDVLKGLNDLRTDLAMTSENSGIPISLTVCTFNTRYLESPRTEIPPLNTLIEGKDVREVLVVDRGYRPRGRTPLFDAVGTMINKVMDNLPEDHGKLFVVMTDGKDNESYKYRTYGLKELVQEREIAGWRFLYIGIGQEDYLVEDISTKMGMSSGSALSVARAATQASFGAIGAAAR